MTNTITKMNSSGGGEGWINSRRDAKRSRHREVTSGGGEANAQLD